MKQETFHKLRRPKGGCNDHNDHCHLHGPCSQKSAGWNESGSRPSISAFPWPLVVFRSALSVRRAELGRTSEADCTLTHDAECRCRTPRRLEADLDRMSPSLENIIPASHPSGSLFVRLAGSQDRLRESKKSRWKVESIRLGGFNRRKGLDRVSTEETDRRLR